MDEIPMTQHDSVIKPERNCIFLKMSLKTNSDSNCFAQKMQFLQASPEQGL